MVELVDTHALGACASRREGSSPFIRTTAFLLELSSKAFESGADNVWRSPLGVGVFRCLCFDDGVLGFYLWSARVSRASRVIARVNSP